MLIQTAATGTSETTVDITAAPTMNASTTRRLSVPARSSSINAKRRASPLSTTTCAMQNIATTKKNTGVMKPATAAPTVVTWNTGWSTITSSEVTAIGIASVTHRTRAIVNTPAR